MGRSHPSRWPHVSQSCVLSKVPKTLPLPNFVATGPFVFGNTRPVCACKPGHSLRVDDPESFAYREVTERESAVRSAHCYCHRCDAGHIARFEFDLAGSEGPEGMKVGNNKPRRVFHLSG